MAIAAGPETVWPWLAQMLRGAGPYGWPRLETTACRSAEHLLPGLPKVRVGDRVGDLFELAGVVSMQELVWRACPGLRVLDVSFDGLTLDYLVEKDKPQTSQLIVRMRALLPCVTAPLRRHISQVLDFILPLHQLTRIKNLAELIGSSRQVGKLSRPCSCRHQAAAFLAAGPA